MVTVSDPLSEKAALAYDWGKGHWWGTIAEKWGIAGQEITDSQFENSIYGRHPVNGQQLIKRLDPYMTHNKYGDEKQTIGHRAGVDVVLRPPKWLGILIANSGDKKLQDGLWQDHVQAVYSTLRHTQQYAGVRTNGGGWALTGKAVVAVFHHDRARPDDKTGYAAPLPHTHAFFLNMSEDEHGKIRALQENEIFESQRFLTSVYRAELSERVQKRGVELVVDRDGVPQAKGFPREYINAASPRSNQIARQSEEIVEKMRSAGYEVSVTPGITKIAAHRLREGKDFNEADMVRMDAAMEASFDNFAHKYAEAIELRGPIIRTEQQHAEAAQQSVTYAIAHLDESEAVNERRAIMREALDVYMTQTTVPAVEAEIRRREESGELVLISREERVPERTTDKTVRLEQRNLELMLKGKGLHRPLVQQEEADNFVAKLAGERDIELNEDQQQALRGLLTSPDQVVALQGKAGVGKTTILEFVARAAERQGFAVVGLGPTGIATEQLEPAKIRHLTLDKFLYMPETSRDGPRLHILDESSLSGSVKFNQLLEKMREQDRIFFVGDRDQHDAIAAGAPFRQAQDAQVPTVWLNTVVRQVPDWYKKVSNLLQAGKIVAALDELKKHGRIVEVEDSEDDKGDARYQAVANKFLENPRVNIAISPDNYGRAAINRKIHRGLQEAGLISDVDHPTKIYVNGRSMSAVARQTASKYQPGTDFVRYRRGGVVQDLETGLPVTIKADTYGRVMGASLPSDTDNKVKVKLEDGRVVTYDPKRLYGVEFFKQDKRDFSVGDTIQFRRPFEDKAVTSKLGVIEDIKGRIFTIKLADGKTVMVDTERFPHLEHGYASTSFLSQSLTARGWVIIHIDTRASKVLVNMKMLKVAVTRGVQDVWIITDSKEKLKDAVTRRQENSIALQAIDDSQTWTEKREARAAYEAMEMACVDEMPAFDFDEPLQVEEMAELAPKQQIEQRAERRGAAPAVRSFTKKVERKEPRDHKQFERSGWRRAKGRGAESCPMCHKGGCSISKDNQVVLCWRVESGDRKNSGAWLHRLDDQTRASLPEIKEVEVRQFSIAPAERLDAVYKDLLNELGLSSRDLKDLEKRGLDRQTIAKNGYKSVMRPQQLNEVMDKLRHHDLRGVPGFFTVAAEQEEKLPGFYKGGVGSWSFNILPKRDRFNMWRQFYDGFLCPALDVDGKIQGFQVRRMDGEKPQPKYIWVSSGKLEDGTSRRPAPPHFRNAEEINRSGQALLLEGVLKTDVAVHLLDNKVGAIGIAGVQVFPDDLGKRLKEKVPGLRQVVVAFDADYARNEQVQYALERLERSLKSAGLEVLQLKWEESEGKGLDDFLLKSDTHKESVRLYLQDAAKSIHKQEKHEQAPAKPQMQYRM